MRTILEGIVTGASRYQILESGQKGAYLYMLQPTSGRNEDLIGNETLKVEIIFDAFEDYKQYEQSFQNLSVFKVDAELVGSPSGKMKVFANSIELLIEGSGIPTEQTATAPAEPNKPEPNKPATANKSAIPTK